MLCSTHKKTGWNCLLIYNLYLNYYWRLDNNISIYYLLAIIDITSYQVSLVNNRIKDSIGRRIELLLFTRSAQQELPITRLVSWVEVRPVLSL